MSKKHLEDVLDLAGIIHHIKQTDENNRTQITIESTDLQLLAELIYLGCKHKAH